MKLFLASTGKHPETVKNLDNYIGGIAGKEIAFIPTATNGQNGYGGWKNMKAWQSINSLNAKITVVQLEDYRDDSVVKSLENKDILWFGGGYSAYLMYWVLRCRLDKHLPQILESGSLYLGSSAGAMVTSKTLLRTGFPNGLKYLDGGDYAGDFLPGLGLIDFHFWPHYEDHMYDYIKDNYKGNKIYLVKDGENIVVEDGNVKVFGEERIITN